MHITHLSINALGENFRLKFSIFDLYSNSKISKFFFRIVPKLTQTYPNPVQFFVMSWDSILVKNNIAPRFDFRTGRWAYCDHRIFDG